MKPEELEDLYLRSFDENLSDSQKESLVSAMRSHEGLATDLSRYKRIRENLIRKTPATFGPYFAQKVINRIQNVGIEIDKQIVLFFRKYQLAALGVLVALLAVNVIFADQLDVPSVLGIDETAATVDEDLLSFDFYDSLTNN